MSTLESAVQYLFHFENSSYTFSLIPYTMINDIHSYSYFAVISCARILVASYGIIDENHHGRRLNEL
jgi:hypothetical protein